MYVFAHLTAELPAEAWAVPSAAVVKHGDGFACFLAEGGKAVRVPVRVGRGDGSFTQVLEKQPPGSAKWEPFAGTEPVIASEAGSLTDGQPVEVKPAGK